MNMKKVFAILMAALLACTLMSCKRDDDVAADDDADKNAGEDMVYENFTYGINGEGTYEITGYTYVGTELKDVAIPAEIGGREVTGVAADAFKAKKTVKSVTIPATVTYIGDFAFYDCDAITSVVIPDSVLEIGIGAFWGCDALADVTLPAGLKAISDYTFKNCPVLTDVALPEGLETIGDAAFWGCEAIEEITIPESVKDMGDTAFYGCTALKKATVLGEALGKTEVDENENETEHTIGQMVFHSCAADLEVVVTEGTEFAKYAEENKYNVTIAE